MVTIRSLGACSLMATAMLAGCGHLPLGHHAPPRGGETITFATSPCFGRCPAYTVTFGPDGQGIFTGEAHTAVTGDRRFTASPDQVSAFTRQLARVRPAGERMIVPGQRSCGPAATDQSTIDVRWQGADGDAHLRLYLGCHGKKARKLADRLRALPMAYLPMQSFLGSD